MSGVLGIIDTKDLICENMAYFLVLTIMLFIKTGWTSGMAPSSRWCCTIQLTDWQIAFWSIWSRIPWNVRASLKTLTTKAVNLKTDKSYSQYARAGNMKCQWCSYWASVWRLPLIQNSLQFFMAIARNTRLECCYLF